MKPRSLTPLGAAAAAAAAVALSAAAAFSLVASCAGVTQIGLIDVDVIVAKIHEADRDKDGALSIDELSEFTRALRQLGRSK